jgi:hypothetical protein
MVLSCPRNADDGTASDLFNPITPTPLRDRQALYNTDAGPTLGTKGVVDSIECQISDEV